MKHKFLIVLLLLFCSVQTVRAQEQVDLQIGDELEFAPIHRDSIHYRYIDLYVKTRFVAHDLQYNSESGEGFYEYFFTFGDFDVSRLPSTYKEKRARIAEFREVSDDKGNVRTIVLAIVVPEKEVVWLEAAAFEDGEVLLVRP